jgi:hypothetical protein
VGTPTAIDRIREVLADRPSTEAELRTIRAQAEGWRRVLEGRLGAAERRLGELMRDPASSLAAIAAELREVDPLRRELADTRVLIERLDARAHELRSGWVTAGRSR